MNPEVQSPESHPLRRRDSAARVQSPKRAVELVRLMVGAHFTFPNEPDRVWVKTGQRSARRCHYTRQPVFRFHGWEPVVYYELPLA